MVILALLITVSAVYSNSLHNAFHFDDQQISDRPNLHLTDLSLTSLTQTIFWAPNNKTIYRPIPCITLALNYYFGQMNPYGYHLVNIFIHLLCSISVYGLTLSLLTLPDIKPSFFRERPYEIAAYSSLLFALHPLQTNVATYIIQRMTSLSALFFLLSVISFISFRKSFLPNCKSNTPLRNTVYCSLVIFFGCCAVASKENSLILPVILWLSDFLLFYPASSTRQKKITRTIYFYIFAIIFLAALFLFFIAPNFHDSFQRYSISNVLNGYDKRDFTLSERLLTEPRIVLFYLYQIILPKINLLNLNHDITLSTSLISPLSTLPALISVLALPVLSFTYRKNYNIISYCILWYFIALLLESTIIPLEIIYEHRTYLPGVTVFLLIGCLLVTVVTKYCRKALAAFVLALVLILYGNGTHLRNFDWRTGLTMWQDIVSKSPNMARAHTNYGRYLMDEGQLYDAKKEFRIAIQLDPDRYEAMANLSKLFISYLNQPEEGLAVAQKLYQQVPPGNYMGSLVLANAYIMLEDYKSAEPYYEEVLTIIPFHTVSINNLGTAQIHNNRKDKAIKTFEYGIQVDSSFFLFAKNLALLHWKEGRTQDAISTLKNYISSNQNNCAEAKHMLKTIKGNSSPKLLEKNALEKNLDYQTELIDK